MHAFSFLPVRRSVLLGGVFCSAPEVVKQKVYTDSVYSPLSLSVVFFFLPQRVDALTVSVHQVRPSHRRITRRANTCEVARKRVLCVFHTVYFRDLDALQSRTPQVRANSVVSNKCEIDDCACEVSRRNGDGALLIFMS